MNTETTKTETARQKAKAAVQPVRVLVWVADGVQEGYESNQPVELDTFDWDDFIDDPQEYWAEVPEEFRALIPAEQRKKIDAVLEAEAVLQPLDGAAETVTVAFRNSASGLETPVTPGTLPGAGAAMIAGGKTVDTPDADDERFEAEMDAYRRAAKELHESEGSVEIDERAVVSVSDDGGAYVAAWVWVDDDDAGVTRGADGDGDGEGESGDDLCDLCGASNVNVSRTTPCGKTIGIECGCDGGNADGVCGDSDCEDCRSEDAKAQEGVTA